MKGGHLEGTSVPPADNGIHGQLSCGEKDIVLVQLWCGASENGAPGVELQLSCSVKFGTPLKSLLMNDKFTVRLFKVPPEAPGFVSLIVWLVAGDPTGCAGNVSRAGVIKSGCAHAVELPNPRQM